jgi:thiol-disulfide isomerase/thioredoxin
MILYISCKTEDKKAVLVIKNSDQDFIEITSPINGIILWNNKKDTIFKNQKKEFVFSKEIDTPEYIEIKIGNQYLTGLLLAKGKVEITAQDSTFSFEGKNALGFQLLNDIGRPFRPYDFTMKEFTEFEKDSTSRIIVGKINLRKNLELHKLKSIFENGKIDNDFYETSKTEIDYFYALKTLQIILAKQNNGNPISKDLLSLIELTVKEYPLNINYKPSAWNAYAQQVLLYKPTYDKKASGSISKDSLTKIYQTDGINKFNLELIFAHSDPQIVDKVAAHYIYTAVIRSKKNERSLIGIFEDFNERFPESVFSDYIKPEINKIKSYQERIALDLPENVKFIDDTNIANFSDLMKKLKGQKYYIDVWATWCGPCKREFKYNYELNALLKKKGYQKLYLSLDKKELKDIWIENIKYYDLNGLHHLVSQEFSEDFANNFAVKKGQNIIPQYLILDEKGNLISNDAPKPSNLSELEKVL